MIGHDGRVYKLIASVVVEVVIRIPDMGRHDAVMDDDADSDGCKAMWRSVRRG